MIKLSPEGTCIIKKQTDLSISGTFIGKDKLAEKEIEEKIRAFKEQLEGIRETRTALENGASGYELAEMVELYETKLKKFQNEWNEQITNAYEPKLAIPFPNYLANHLKPLDFIKRIGNHSINDNGFGEISNTFKLKKYEQETKRIIGYLEFKQNQKA